MEYVPVEVYFVSEVKLLRQPHEPRERMHICSRINSYTEYIYTFSFSLVNTCGSVAYVPESFPVALRTTPEY